MSELTFDEYSALYRCCRLKIEQALINNDSRTETFWLTIAEKIGPFTNGLAQQHYDATQSILMEP